VRVYHLLSAKWAIEDLQQRQLKVARFADLNDPFELLAHELPDKKDRREYNLWVRRASRTFGLLCFSREWRNPVLWSHYGAKHRGICLGFDVPDQLLARVEYLERRIPFRRLVPYRRNGSDTAGPLFRMKFKDWSYEREWRRVVRLRNARSDGDDFFWPFGEDLDLREVIAGPRSRTPEERLRQAVGPTARDVSFIQARAAFREFCVVVQQRGFGAPSGRAAGRHRR
jgi:hypothetical protein